MPSKHRAFVRELAPDVYDRLLELQGGGCAICRVEPKARRLHIDHDHRTMQVRGLLCHRCNRSLSPWVTPEWCEDAADYLLYPPAGRLTDPTAAMHYALRLSHGGKP